MRSEHEFLRLGIVEPPGFAVHHELFGKVKVHGLPTLWVVPVDVVPDEARQFGLADGEICRVPLAQLAVCLLSCKKKAVVWICRCISTGRFGARPPYFLRYAHGDSVDTST